MGWVARPLWTGSAWHINQNIWEVDTRERPAGLDGLLGTWAVGTVPPWAAPEGRHPGRADELRVLAH